MEELRSTSGGLSQQMQWQTPVSLQKIVHFKSVDFLTFQLQCRGDLGVQVDSYQKKPKKSKIFKTDLVLRSAGLMVGLDDLRGLFQP